MESFYYSSCKHSLTTFYTKCFTFSVCLWYQNCLSYQ